ncbi:MAG: N-acetylmuramic acid 6-phosphate etherase [Nitrospirae bacterium]|nr:MAG: N-acetylmuramic acid 6-phosphate etherase [Nitrospirota bacterium]
MKTEDRHTKAEDIDILPLDEVLLSLARDYERVSSAVRGAVGQIASLVEDAVDRFKKGGDIIYIGAGTSGRLGVMEAAEIYPTFGVSKRVRAVIAGGNEAVFSSKEGAEDDENAGRLAVKGMKSADMLIGISASGSTPFVLSALREAKTRGMGAWLITSNRVEYKFLDGVVFLDTGPEMVAGSTRMKAGTAAKVALNMISTSLMIRLGRVYRGYMVDLVPMSEKLKRRATGIVSSLTGASADEARELLERTNWKTKVALVVKKKGITPEEAEKLLNEKGGFLRDILG